MLFPFQFFANFTYVATHSAIDISLIFPHSIAILLNMLVPKKFQRLGRGPVFRKDLTVASFHLTDASVASCVRRLRELRRLRLGGAITVRGRCQVERFFKEKLWLNQRPW